jgi:AraC-like DNA-binding protein
MEQYLPNHLLQPFIKRFMIIESEHGMRNNILPDTSIVMAFCLKGSVSYAEEGINNELGGSVITGIRKSARIIQYSQRAATLLVIFKEGGAAAFFAAPLHELSGISLSLDYLIQCQKIQDVEERLAEANNNVERIAIVERFLLSELKKTQHDGLVLNTIQKIQTAKGDIRIKDILTDLHISRDPFEKRFRRITGTSPKQFAVIIRLRHLIDHYTDATSLTNAAHTAGYFDQAHFIKDFRSFTGQTPHAFFKSPLYW